MAELQPQIYEYFNENNNLTNKIKLESESKVQRVQKQVTFVIPTQENLEIRTITKTKKSTKRDIELQEEAFDLNIVKEEEPKFQKITDKEIQDSNELNNIYGYKNVTAPIHYVGEELPRPIKSSVKTIKFHNIESDVLNTYKFKYRSGYQANAGDIDKLTTDQQLILMDTTLPYEIGLLNKGIYGDMNGANGLNGLQKANLYYSNYLSQDGVGNRQE